MNLLEIILAGITIVLVMVIIIFIVFLKDLLSSLNYFESNGRKVKQENFCLLNECAKKGQTVFAGDSITEMCHVDEMYADFAAKSGQIIYNRGISGDVTDELLERFDSNILTLEPQNLILLIGTNDLARGVAEERIVKNVDKLLGDAKRRVPEINLILQAVYPTNDTIIDKKLQLISGGKETKKGIDHLNSRLKELSDKHNAQWVDLTEELSNAEGLLKPEYTVDGLHLNVKGYRVVAKKILPLLKNGRQENSMITGI